MPQCLNDDTIVLNGIRYPNDPVIMFVLTIRVFQLAPFNSYSLPSYFDAIWQSHNFKLIRLNLIPTLPNAEVDGVGVCGH